MQIENQSYHRSRKQMDVFCDNCGKIFRKPVSEFMRNLKKNMKNFCSLSCSVKRTNNSRNNKEDESFRLLLRNCKSHKRRTIYEKNIDVSITIGDLKEIWTNQDGICPYTGIKMQLKTRTKAPSLRLIQASIDRIDSSKPYTKDNIEIVCMGINYMKNKDSKEDTLKFLEMIKNPITD